MDILKYVLAQATDWCAGFLVRVWWRYLRLSIDDTKMTGKCWAGQKVEKTFPWHSALCFI
jgi:hypothetical protein